MSSQLLIEYHLTYDEVVFFTMALCGSECKLPQHFMKVSFWGEEWNDFIDFHGARIKPKELYMKNAYEGKHIHETVTIQNITSCSITVRTLDPSSTNFTILDPARGETISPGLSFRFRITCTYTAINKAHHCWVPILINEDIYYLPVSVALSAGHIYSIPQIINFDRVNSTPYVNTKSIYLHNCGCKTSKFEIDHMTSDMNFIVHPQKGMIPPNGSVKVNVEFVGIGEGIFSKEIWVKCEKPFRIPVYANVIKPSLVARGPSLGENFSIIRLTPIYGACTSQGSFVFSNINTLNSMFVVLPDIEHRVMSDKDAEKMGTCHNYVNISPKEGTLGPDEVKTLKITFSSNSDLNTMKDKPYFIVFRVIRIDCTKATIEIEEQRPKSEDISMGMTKEQSSQISLKSNTKKYTKCSDSEITKKDIEEMYKISKATDFLRICLYVMVNAVKVVLSPQDLNFEPLPVNSKASKTISIYNKSRVLPIHFRYRKTAFVEINPKRGYLYPREMLDLNLTIEPRAAGQFNITVTIDLLYPNQPVKDGCPVLANVGNRTASVHFEVKLEHTKPRPKFNMGITPMITNEVGIVGNGVTFNSVTEKPRAAILDLKKTKSTALIAFPNDRSQSLRPYNNTAIPCKTIFAKIPRVVTLQDEYMLTQKEISRKNDQKKCYEDFLRHRHNDSNCDTEFQEDYSAECKNMMETLFHNTIASLSPEKIVTQRRKKIINLTPMDIYFIRITPMFLDIGKIALSSTTTTELKVVNMIDVPVTVSLLVNKSGSYILKKLPRDVVIPANGETKLEIEVYAYSLGKYNTIIHVLINQSFTITVGLAMHTTRLGVKLDQTEISVDTRVAYASRQVNVINPFHVPVSFIWSCPVGGCFTVEPATGEVPQKRSLTCTVYYIPNMKSRASSKITISCESGMYQTLLTTVIPESSDVEFLEKQLNFSYLPLNIMQEKHVKIINYGYEAVLFEIKNPNPFPGITVLPATGQIERRGYRILYITAHITALIEFNCTLDIECHTKKELSLHISGNVEFPSVQFIPHEIQLKRIVAGGIDVQFFKVQNISNAQVMLTFVKDCFPELKIYSAYDMTEEQHEVLIEPNEQIEFYMKYLPLDVCLNQLYLPIVLNKLLGPSFFGSQETMQAETFLRSNLDIYANEENVTCNKCLSNLPVLLLHVVASKPILNVSNLILKFKYISHKKSTISRDITITNMRDVPTEFCIRTDDIYPNFKMSFIECQNIEKFEKALAITLDRSESVRLQFEFVPSTYGNFNVKLPIFIKEYNNCNVFNSICLMGNYIAPLLESVPEILLEPMMVGLELERKFVISATYHEDNCSLIVKTDLYQINVEEAKNGRSRKNKFLTDITMVLRFISENPISFKSKINIVCSCGAQCLINVFGCADNCFLTFHALSYLTLQKDSSGDVLVKKPDSVYPLCAEETDSDYYAYFIQIIDVLEKWLYEQVMCFYIYIPIPRGMGRPMHNYEKNYNTKKQNKKEIRKDSYVIVKILKTFLDEDAPESIVKGTVPENPVKRVRCLYVMYTSVLALLESYGAFLPHIKPQYLMMHPDYVIYTRKVKSEEPLTLKEFFKYSAPAWIDVLLQIIKCFVLSEIMNSKSLLSENASDSSVQKSNCILNFSELNATKYVDAETILLNWLSLHYNKQLEKLKELDDINDSNFKLTPKQIGNFNSDLSNGLPFLAVILSYCPYLVECIGDIYIMVNTPEKAHHNAAQVIYLMRMLNCSFKLKPSHIVNPCTIHMILFTSYMFGVFPHLSPQSSVEFKAELGYLTEHEILLTNPNQKVQYFNALLLKNEKQSFHLEKDNPIRVLPNKSTKIKIIFQAKKSDVLNTTLLFCGDTDGQLYSKSLVFTLVGVPLFNQESDSIVISIPLFTIKEKQLKIKSPYHQRAEYEIWFTYIPPNEQEVLTIYPLKEMLKFVVPRFNYTSNRTLVTNEEGIGALTITVCCCRYSHRVYIFFVNSEVGDFFIKLSCQSCTQKSSKVERMSLHTEVPFYWSDTKCTCNIVSHVSRQKCARWLKVRVPGRNEMLWKCVVDMMLLQVDEEYVPGWKKYLESDVGPFIGKWLTINNTIITSDIGLHLLNETNNYTVNTSNSDFELPKSMRLDNVFSTETTTMYIHVSDKAANPLKPLDFTMLSENSIEVRFYRVFFHKCSSALVEKEISEHQ